MIGIYELQVLRAPLDALLGDPKGVDHAEYRRKLHHSAPGYPRSYRRKLLRHSSDQAPYLAAARLGQDFVRRRRWWGFLVAGVIVCDGPHFFGHWARWCGCQTALLRAADIKASKRTKMSPLANRPFFLTARRPAAFTASDSGPASGASSREDSAFRRMAGWEMTTSSESKMTFSVSFRSVSSCVGSSSRAPRACRNSRWRSPPTFLATSSGRWTSTTTGFFPGSITRSVCAPSRTMSEASMANWSLVRVTACPRVLPSAAKASSTIRGPIGRSRTRPSSEGTASTTVPRASGFSFYSIGLSI